MALMYLTPCKVEVKVGENDPMRKCHPGQPVPDICKNCAVVAEVRTLNHVPAKDWIVVNVVPELAKKGR